MSLLKSKVESKKTLMKKELEKLAKNREEERKQ